MDLGTFRSHYSNSSGSVEYVHSAFYLKQYDRMYCSRAQLNFFTNHKDNPMDQIFIFFTDEKSVGVKTMRKYVSSCCSLQFAYSTTTFQGWLLSWKRRISSEASLSFPGTWLLLREKYVLFADLNEMQLICGYSVGYRCNGATIQTRRILRIRSSCQYYASHSCSKTRSPHRGAEKDTTGQVVSVIHLLVWLCIVWVWLCRPVVWKRPNYLESSWRILSHDTMAFVEGMLSKSQGQVRRVDDTPATGYVSSLSSVSVLGSASSFVVSVRYVFFSFLSVALHFQV